jgi:chemotaxis protein MotB
MLPRFRLLDSSMEYMGMNFFTRMHPARLLVLLALGVALSAGTGCVSQEEHKRLESAFEQSRQQLAEAEHDIEGLRTQVQNLEAQLAEKEALLAAGNSGVEALKKERDSLLAEVARLHDQIEKLLANGAGLPALPADINNALQALAEQYPDLLEYDPKLGMIRFKSDLTFDLGSTEVKPRAREALHAFAQILNNAAIAQNEVRIVGHTDDVPIRATTKNVMNPTNWYLSTNRAHAVREVLQKDAVSDARMQAAGWGEERPIAPNAPGHRGNEKNRRVDIYILPTTVPTDLTISTPGAPHSHRPVPATAPSVDAVPNPG